MAESIFIASTSSEVEIILYADPKKGTPHRHHADSHSHPSPREAACSLPVSLPRIDGPNSDPSVQIPSIGVDKATKINHCNTSNQYTDSHRLGASITKVPSLVRRQLPLIQRQHGKNQMPYSSGELVDYGAHVVDEARVWLPLVVVSKEACW